MIMTIRLTIVVDYRQSFDRCDSDYFSGGIFNFSRT